MHCIYGVHKTKKNGMTALTGKFLMNILGHNYIKYINFLIKHEIIKTDNHWKKGKYSKGYIFTDKYINSEYVFRTLTDKKLLSQIKKHIFSNNKTMNLCDIKNQKTTQYYEHKYLVKNLKTLKFVSEPVMNKEEYKSLKSYHVACINVNKIKNQEFYDRTSDKTNRVYTNLTSLNKNLIKYTNFQYSIDVSSSQLWVLSFLIKNYLKTHNIPVINHIKEYKYSMYDLHFSKLEMENQIFQNELKNKEFYNEYVVDNIDYSEKKIKFFKYVLFSDYKFHSADFNPVIQKFKKAFPEIFKFIALYKKQIGHSEFCCLLQSLEADIIINQTAIPLSRTINLLTKHDEILCTNKEDLLTIQNHLESVYFKYNEILPNMKLKYNKEEILYSMYDLHFFETLDKSILKEKYNVNNSIEQSILLDEQLKIKEIDWYNGVLALKNQIDYKIG